ncbi:hypothetical protein Pcinc_029041 [Petrolisthes cinctipes]|uniref:GRIP1 associated protein 1 n=1 Tax=Petrolisthes cinctipes TaxID=88211 RepID=A0AAE1F1Q7_PETCI|nr:hypothetical protein Pcinc_029041 [Petrolisthes cinctipes]
MAELNPDDFNRLQTQLLELREKNYSLEDAITKQKRELGDTRTRLKNLEEENHRYQTLVKTSRKVSEVELMVRDNNYLRNKLKDQEEDFRLQNNTLLQELSRLVGENERYERQMEVLCGDRAGGMGGEGGHGFTDDSKEVVRLRGELSAMERRLHETEKQAETEVRALKEKISSLNLQVTQLTNILKTHSIPVDEGEINLAKGGGVSFKKLTLQDDDGLECDVERKGDPLDEYEERTNQLQGEVEKIHNILREEKERTQTLTSEKLKLEEDLKSANERLTAVMAEIEVRKNEEEGRLTEGKEVEAKLRSQAESMRVSLEEMKKSQEETQANLREKTHQWENQQLSLQQLTSTLNQTQEKLTEIQDQVKVLTKDCSQITEEKKTLEEKNLHLQQELSHLRSTLDSLKCQLEEQTKLADNRRSLIEEMKQHMSEDREQHRQEVERLCVQHGEELVSLTSLNQQLKHQLEEINEKISEASSLKEKVTDLETERVRLESEVVQRSEELKAANMSAEEEINRLTAQNLQQAEDLKWKWDEEKKDLQTQLEISTIQRQEAEEAVETFKRKVADGEEEQRIHERKGMTLLKDLKKQLAVERKRADRLQEKLSQLLTDPAQLTAITTMSEGGDDVSSVSSWSMVSGELRDTSTRDNSILASPQGSPPPGLVSEETASLVNRVTELQQQKWQLEERITHLESSSAAMADDILKKSAIIQHYCMDQKTQECGTGGGSPQHGGAAGGLVPGPGHGVRRVLDLLRGGTGTGEESLREINRRLQSLLEETLAKNMQLHTDVDHLSQQVHQLAKLAAVTTQPDTTQSDASTYQQEEQQL